jgi:hypothetical protein
MGGSFWYDGIDYRERWEMGRKRLPEGEKKEAMTIHIPGWLRDEIRKIPGYNLIIEKLLVDYLDKMDKVKK